MRRECRAKINLFLKVLGRRPDGYHELWTLFQEIDVHDTLVYEPGSGELELEIVGAALGAVEENLVFKAARLFGDRLGRPIGGRFSLRKRIPAGGGLGGGSSDAAGALALLNEAHRYPFSHEDLRAMALTLGADVPFFLEGGMCEARGVGERLRPVVRELPFDGGFLLIPDFGVPTGPVFRELAAGPSDPAHESAASHAVPAIGENDLFAPACRLFPRLAEIREAWPCRETGESLFMTGSGSTLVWFTDRPRLDREQEAIAARFDLKTVPFRRWSKPADRQSGIGR